MNRIEIYCKDGWSFVYNDEMEVKENFLFDLCDMARLGIEYIVEIKKDTWLPIPHKEQGILAIKLNYLRLIAEDGLRENSETIFVNWF